MARVFSVGTIPKNIPTWQYNAFRQIAASLDGANGGLSAILRGELPDGSGTPLVDLSKFFYKPGIAGGQLAFGGANAGDNLTLSSTNNGTRGKIYLGALQTQAAFDETNGFLGVGTVSPAGTIHTVATAPSGSTLTTSSDLVNRWAGPYTGAGTPIGGTSSAALASNDGTGSYMAVLPGTLGTNPQENLLNGVILDNRVYQITCSIFTLSGTFTAGSLIKFRLVSSSGISYAAGNYDLTGISTTPTTITTTLSTSAASAFGTGTANSIQLDATGNALFVCVSYVAVALAPSEALTVQAATTNGSNVLVVRGSTYSPFLFRVLDNGKFFFENGAGSGVMAQATVNALTFSTFTGSALLKMLPVASAWSDAQSALAAEFGTSYGVGRYFTISSSGATQMDRLGISALSTLLSNTTIANSDFLAPSASPELFQLVHSTTGGVDGSVIFKINNRRSTQTGNLLQITSAVASTVDTVINARNVLATGRVKTAVLFTDDNATIANAKLVGLNVDNVTAGQTRTLSVTNGSAYILTDANVVVDTDSASVVVHDGQVVVDPSS